MSFGDGIRRNLNNVTVAERTRLKDVIIELNQRFYPGSRTDTPVGGVTKWFSQDQIHQATHVHGGPAFLPWHRELINRFETLLREVEPQLSLHYWDWTTNPQNLFTTTFMGAANGDGGEPWLSGGIYNPTADPFRAENPFDPAHQNPADPPRSLTRQVQAGAPVTASQDASVVDSGDFPQMRLILEGLHNTCHGFIGGTLGSSHISFRDPFVFLLHSNVDRLFAMWQTAPGKSARLDPNLVYGAEGTHPEITENLEPWAGGTGTRPWAAPDNQQQVKTSKHPSVVTPPVYDTVNLPLSGLVHLQSIGDVPFHDNQFAGTRGQSRRLEGFQLQFTPRISGLSMRYMAHLQSIGDSPFVNEGQFVGTRKQSRRLEGFAIELIGPRANSFNVEYMAHLQNFGDTGFSSNGQFCGTRSQSRRVEGILVRVKPK